MELVSKKDITNYSQRNTSPKMPIEQQYVYAFIDALMNSTSLQEVYETLADEMQNGDAFIIFNSFYYTTINLNKEPYRSIIAYSMLKKDIRLFELISASMFTGKVLEYHGSDLYTNVAKTTDETPLKYTDMGLYTDMSEGLIQIGFQNYFCNEPASDGGGSEYQTLDEIYKSITDFDYIITLTKPARVEVLMFYVPYCYLSGTDTEIYSAGVDTSFVDFQVPFGDEKSMEIINDLNDNELMELYKEVSMWDTVLGAERTIETERQVVKGDGFIMFSYDIRTQSIKAKDPSDPDSDEQEFIWSKITIRSNTADKTYIQEKTYNVNNDHYEKYIPIMLRLKDGPNAPCLAFQVEHDVATIGAMFYTRDKI